MLLLNVCIWYCSNLVTQGLIFRSSKHSQSMLTSAETWLLNPLGRQILHFPIGIAAEQPHYVPVKKSWEKKEMVSVLVKNVNSQSQRSQSTPVKSWHPDPSELCKEKHTGGVEVVINTNSKTRNWFMNCSSDWRTSLSSQLKKSRCCSCFTGCKYMTCLQKLFLMSFSAWTLPAPQLTPPGLSFRALTTLTVTLTGKNPNFLLKHFKTWKFLP